jgi:DNA-binding GntR family transcriptional regulator
VKVRQMALPASNHAVNSRNLKHAVSSYVREGVFSGTLKAGERIDQDELAEILGVSKIPVREALIGLEAEALVINLPRRGSFVGALTAQDVVDQFHMTGLIAGFAASRATDRLTDSQLGQLEAILDDMRTNRDGSELRRLNDNFHRIINDAGCTTRIRSILGLLSDGIPSRFYEFAVGWSEVANDFHRQIVDALKERDAQKAGALMARHVRDGSSEAVKLLEEIGFWKSDEDTGRSRRPS